MPNRIFYNVERVWINGSIMTNTVVDKMTTYFKLAQVFCSCGGMRMNPNLNIEYHNEDCPGAIGMEKIGYVNDNGREIYFKQERKEYV